MTAVVSLHWRESSPSVISSLVVHTNTAQLEDQSLTSWKGAKVHGVISPATDKHFAQGRRSLGAFTQQELSIDTKGTLIV
jgi:hypothetical protein